MTSLEEKIGQLIVVGFHGTSDADPGVQKLLSQAASGKIGGTILFRYNIEAPGQVRDLTRAILEAAGTFPPFIFADQEGGRVQRLNRDKGFADFLPAKSVAASLSEDDAVHHYQDMGKLLKKAGVNFDFAPCADLDTDPPCPVIGGLDRSYSANVAEVIRFAGTMMDGLKKEGILNCIKHFPGHGRARGDTHMGLVDITRTWTEEELAPFEGLIGRGGVDAVMTAHVVHDGIDPATPASLSENWIKKLRTDLKFDGVVIPDDLHMGAILHRFSLDEIVIRGLNAGLDLLLFSNNPLAARDGGIRHDRYSTLSETAAVPDEDLPDKILAAVRKALNQGRLSMERIDSAFLRVTALKERLTRLQG